MFTTIENVEYHIRFRHYHGVDAFPWEDVTTFSPSPPHVTICEIEGEITTDTGKPTYFIAATGRASCSYNDQYNKETGRKLALKRALVDGEFSREDRTKFWAAYRGRVPAKWDVSRSRSALASIIARMSTVRVPNEADGR